MTTLRDLGVAAFLTLTAGSFLASAQGQNAARAANAGSSAHIASAQDAPPARPQTPTLAGVRVDPMTLGAGPQGLDSKALVLFDGKEWIRWRTTGGEESTWQVQEDGSVKVGGGDAMTERSFGDFQLHLEFLCPEIKGATGQAKANSGVYLHGRYEVQILDSYGLSPSDDRCGGIYSKAVPTTNAALPAGRWQSYDIFFRAPRFGEDGKVTERPRVTVLHNGVLIHNNVELDGTTPGGIATDMVPKGPIMLQDHGDPVRYRNIWIRPE